MTRRFQQLAAALCGALAFACAQAGPKLDDATIFAILDQANTTDIWVARLAVRKGHSSAVRALGRMVAEDHEGAQQAWRALAKKLGVVPTPPVDDASAAQLAQAISRLQSRTGPDFDRAYLEHEIAFHSGALDTIRGTLLPAVANAEFREQVRAALPAFEGHLAHTRETAKKLGLP